MFHESAVPAEDRKILERIAKASDYFQDKINSILIIAIDNLQIETDNKELGKKSRNIVKLLEEETKIKLAAVQSCKNGFSPTKYFRAISAAALQSGKPHRKKPAGMSVTYTESDIAHPELFENLKKWRADKAKAEGIPHFQVLHQKTLIQLVVNLPDTVEKFEQIKGIGKKLSERYGDELITMISKYRREHDIEAVFLPSKASPEVKKTSVQKGCSDTKQHTLELFEKGMTITEIAVERKLTEQTIEGHLAHHIEIGNVAATTLLSAEKLEMMTEHLKELNETSLKTAKDSLDIEVTYGELRMALAHLKHLRSSAGS